jgi:hypothetical protein
LDRQAFDRMISLIDKRVFLLHNVHEDEPQVFQTRWAMNYLPGPLTRAQIPALNALVGASGASPAVAPQAAQGEESLGQDVPPAVPGAIPEFYYPIQLGPVEALRAIGEAPTGEPPQARTLYRPALVGQARVALLARKYNLSREELFTMRIDEMKRRGLVRWEQYVTSPIDLDALSQNPPAGAQFDSLDNLAIDDAKFVSGLETDFTDWIYRTQAMTIRVHEDLEVAAGPDVSDEDFAKMVADAAAEQKQAEVDEVREKYEDKLDKLEAKLKKETLEYEEDKQELSHRRMEEVGKGIENVIGLIGGRRRSITTSLTKRRMTSKAKADLEASQQDIAAVEAAMDAMEKDLAEELQEISDRWDAALDDVTEIPIAPYKKNIFIEMFGLIWLPYYAFEDGDDWLTAPAFEWEATE